MSAAMSVRVCVNGNAVANTSRIVIMVYVKPRRCTNALNAAVQTFQHSHTQTQLPCRPETHVLCYIHSMYIVHIHTTSLTLRRKSFSGTRQEVFQTSLCAHSINSQQSSQLSHAGAAVSRTIRAGKLCQRKIAAHPPRPRSSQPKFPSLYAYVCIGFDVCLSRSLLLQQHMYMHMYISMYTTLGLMKHARARCEHHACMAAHAR